MTMKNAPESGMSRAEHRAEAERLLAQALDPAPSGNWRSGPVPSDLHLLMAAQVHATLATTAPEATAVMNVSYGEAVRRQCPTGGAA